MNESGRQLGEKKEMFIANWSTFLSVNLLFSIVVEKNQEPRNVGKCIGNVFWKAQVEKEVGFRYDRR